MLKNYLTIALRNLTKRKGYALINGVGLAVGLAAALLIVLFAYHELTYDRFHERADDLYLVYKERVTPTGTQVTRDTWVPLLAELEATYPAVTNGARVYQTSQWVRRDDQRFEEEITYTDPGLFEAFTFPLVEGDPATVLSDPFSVVLTETTARKYFGDASPLGRVLRINNSADYTVTGVLADVPSNSTLALDVVVPIVSDPDYEELTDEWGSSFLYTFVELAPGTDPAELEAQFPAFITRIWDAETAGRTNMKLEPLVDLYHTTTGNRTYAYILLGVAAAILLIACINFTNLATARSMERAREIGMRKALGAQRGQLAAQFLGESVLLSFLALGAGLGLIELVLPAFNDLYGLQLGLGLLPGGVLAVALAGLALVVGLLAGGYPALYLSGFAPIASLRGDLQHGRGGARLRQGLVVTQFALAVVLIVGTLVVQRQIRYMQNAELRFDGTQVVAVEVEPTDFEDAEQALVRLESFKDELRRQSVVLDVASSSHIPGDWPGWFTFARGEGWGDRDPLRLRTAYVDDRFFATLGIDLLNGRSFDPERPTDPEEAVILNEAALAAFGWSEPDGHVVQMGDRALRVIGVVQDYHVQSLQEEIAPILHLYRPGNNGVHNFVTVRLRPERPADGLAALQSAWATLDPVRAMPYAFLGDQFAQLYEAEERLAVVASVFGGLAVLIACLGLFGLASLIVTRRLREVGVRKVLGASVPGLVVRLTGDFIRPVLIALAVGLPAAYLLMQRWLENFAYRTDIGAAPLALSALAAVAIAVVTVGYQVTRAALTNPADVLRQE